MADFAGLKRYMLAIFQDQLKVLFTILNAESSCNTKSVLFPTDKEAFSKLSALSSRHKTDYYLFTYFQHFPDPVPAEQLQRLREKMTRQAVRSLRQLGELISICKIFNQRGIKYGIIKGPHLARMLYGNAAVKVSVDLDVMMVKPDDLEVFHEVLTGAGYTCSEQELMTGTWKQRMFISAKREVHYFNREAGCAVDLHVKPLANTIFTARRYRDFFKDIEKVPFEGIMIPVLPAEKYFVYLCYHAACHQFGRLAWLMDIRNFYLIRKDSLDINGIMSVARPLNMERPVYLAFVMLKLLFEMDFPKEIKSLAGKTGLIERLARSCLKAISLERGEELKFRARVDRIVYLIRLNMGLAGKADVMVSVILRHLVLILFKRKENQG